MYAAIHGKTEALALLVEAGADTNAKDKVSAPAGTPRGGWGPGGVGGAGGARAGALAAVGGEIGGPRV